MVYVGKKSWVTEQIDVVEPAFQERDFTSVWIGTSRRMIARLDFADTVRADSSHVVKSLMEEGKRVYLLSGDCLSVAKSIGSKVGILPENILGDKSPSEKAAFVRALRGNGERVAMVGDGVNDAIALSAADVGIAMGKGTDAAGSASNVILLGDRLSQVTEALHVGGATLSKIKQNLLLALVYNLIGIPVAAGVLLPEYNIMLSPTFAAGMMACSSILVVTNSLLLKKR